MLYIKPNFKHLVPVSLLIIVLFTSSSGSAQELIRRRLQQRFHRSGSTLNTQNSMGKYIKTQIAGLDVAVWEPKKYPAPLVIFSHGFGGINVQSKFIMQALADAGYLVMAPNHKDARARRSERRTPEISFKQSAQWNDTTYISRHDDIERLLKALKDDNNWKKQIDWSKIALCGHSLGGYTVLGLGGAWPSWKQKGIKAILALSPYCQPYVLNGNLANMHIPVMYQGGTRDFGVTPTVKKLDGAFTKTAPPVYFVEFSQLGHFGWTDYNRNKSEKDLINYYCVSFLDKYVKENKLADPSKKLPGVAELRIK